MAGAASATGSTAAGAATVDCNAYSWAAIASIRSSEIRGKSTQEKDAIIIAKIREIAQKRQEPLSDDQIATIKSKVYSHGISIALSFALGLAGLRDIRERTLN